MIHVTPVCCPSEGVIFSKFLLFSAAENIFFCHNGVKLGDFGLAVDLSENKKYNVRGTVPYISKELFRREGYGTSADIYAAGCVILCLLSGSPPWKGCDRDFIIYQVIHQF